MDLKYSRHIQNPTKGTVGKWGGIFNSSSVAALGFQIHGFQKYFSSDERGKRDLKIEKMQNVPHFSYFLEKFII